MATFSESQITDIAEILETNSDVLGYQLDLNAPIITESDKTKVLAKITEWATAGANFTAIEPKEANFGAKISPNSQKDQIRRQIAALTYTTELLNTGSSQGVVYPL